MAKPEWLNKYLRMKPEVSDIFDDLENYRKFCVSYGYVFDEAHLYSERNQTYNEYLNQNASPKKIRSKNKSRGEIERSTRNISNRKHSKVNSQI